MVTTAKHFSGQSTTEMCVCGEGGRGGWGGGTDGESGGGRGRVPVFAVLLQGNMQIESLWITNQARLSAWFHCA